MNKWIVSTIVLALIVIMQAAVTAHYEAEVYACETYWKWRLR